MTIFILSNYMVGLFLKKDGIVFIYPHGNQYDMVITILSLLLIFWFFECHVVYASTTYVVTMQFFS